MFIPYSSPNFYVSDLLPSLLTRKSVGAVEEFFRYYSGKKYILVTTSCRAALYLALSCLERQGEVITTPLACRSALDPILWSGNKLAFADVDRKTLNHSDNNIIDLVRQGTVAIQIVNHGGIPFPVKRLKDKLPDGNQPIIIEDCAQAFGAVQDGYPAGYFADIACYSLIKNGYGIGGGILATDNHSIFEKAKELQCEFASPSHLITAYRLIRNTLETYRHHKALNILYGKLIMAGKSHRQSQAGRKELYLKRPHKLYAAVFLRQSKKINELHLSRRKKGQEMIQKLHKEGLITNYQNIDLSGCSFTKLFISNPAFEAKGVLDYLHENNIEAKHLEQRADSALQPLLDQIYGEDKYEGLEECVNYKEINYKIISLPLYEKMKRKQIDFIIEKLRDYLSL